MPTIPRALDTAALPWIPLGPGESFKPIRFLRRDLGRILLLRLEPGTLVPLHRHAGEVHAFNVAGSRLLVEAREIVGPGGYVYEPPGNVDSWRAVGDEPVVVHITAYGAMEYLDERGQPSRKDSGESLLDVYLRHCREHGLEPLDLTERAPRTGA